MSDQKYPKAYACYNKDVDIRLKSTSGGLFTVFAEYVLEELHGVVFGAAFDESFSVRHIMVDNADGLERLRGSKYPQSDIGDCYRQAREYLEKKTVVLFTGLPCQIAALHCYLGKPYENLYCLDLVCHGVASPGVWRGYLAECRDGSHIQTITFKDKVKGWKRWYVKFQYATHTWYRRGSMEPFMRSYLNYANIRPSCYDCRFKGIRHVSDFTVSDCWGKGEENRALNDNKGLSALLLQNERAEEVFAKLRDKLVWQEYDADYLLQDKNFTAYRSVFPHKHRQKFFELYKEKGAGAALRKMFYPRLKTWIKYYYLRMVGKEK